MSDSPTVNGAAARLAEIQAKREQLAAAREQRAEISPEEQLAIAERDLRDDEALDKFEREVGRIGTEIQIVRSSVGAVIVKRPHMATYRKWQASLTRDSDDPGADEINLVRPNVLHPSKEEFDRLIERQPFLLSRCTSAVCELAGVRKKEIEKKY